MVKKWSFKKEWRTACGQSSSPWLLIDGFLSHAPRDGSIHGRMNYKDTKPYMSAFLWNWPVNRLCGIVFNRFYRLEIHSLSGLYFRPSLWTVAPMDEGNILVYCCPSTVPSLWPPPPSRPFSRKCTVYTDKCMAGVGGGGCWIVLSTIFCSSFTFCFWPDSEPTKFLHPPQTNDQLRRH